MLHEYNRAALERIFSAIVVAILSVLTLNAIVRLGELARLLAIEGRSAAAVRDRAVAEQMFMFSLWYWYIDGHDWRGRMPRLAGLHLSAAARVQPGGHEPR